MCVHIVSSKTPERQLEASGASAGSTQDMDIVPILGAVIARLSRNWKYSIAKATFNRQVGSRLPLKRMTFPPYEKLPLLAACFHAGGSAAPASAAAAALSQRRPGAS